MYDVGGVKRRSGLDKDKFVPIDLFFIVQLLQIYWALLFFKLEPSFSLLFVFTNLPLQIRDVITHLCCTPMPAQDHNWGKACSYICHAGFRIVTQIKTYVHFRNVQRIPLINLQHSSLHLFGLLLFWELKRGRKKEKEGNKGGEYCNRVVGTNTRKTGRIRLCTIDVPINP